jgi:hypothetical protein
MLEELREGARLCIQSDDKDSADVSYYISVSAQIRHQHSWLKGLRDIKKTDMQQLLFCLYIFKRGMG